VPKIELRTKHLYRVTVGSIFSFPIGFPVSPFQVFLLLRTLMRIRLASLFSFPILPPPFVVPVICRRHPCLLEKALFHTSFVRLVGRSRKKWRFTNLSYLFSFPYEKILKLFLKDFLRALKSLGWSRQLFFFFLTREITKPTRCSAGVFLPHVLTGLSLPDDQPFFKPIPSFPHIRGRTLPGFEQRSSPCFLHAFVLSWPDLCNFPCHKARPPHFTVRDAPQLILPLKLFRPFLRHFFGQKHDEAIPSRAFLHPGNFSFSPALLPRLERFFFFPVAYKWVSLRSFEAARLFLTD